MPFEMDSTISIHAPREGGDYGCKFFAFPWQEYFNPRPPRGGRRPLSLLQLKYIIISIHAPREGGDKRMTAAPM